MAVEIQGTLREDGTLLLDEKPALPAGRVKVTVEPTAAPAKTEIWRFFEKMRAEREALGLAPQSQEEIDDYLATMRDDSERCQLIEKIQEEGRLRRERQEPSEAG